MPRNRSHKKSIIAKAWSWFIRGPWRTTLPILVGIVGLFSFFNEITDFINHLNENFGLMVTVAVAVSLLITTVALWYLITRRTKLARITKFLIVGVSAIVLFISIGYGWYSYSTKKAREQKFIIAIAEFYSTNQENNYGVTEDISYKLEQLLADEPDITVELLSKPIKETDGREEAIRQGNKIEADLVFWGWYTTTPTDVLVTIHIEDLKTREVAYSFMGFKTNETANYGLTDSYQVQENITKINTFELQKSISDDFSSVAYFLKGELSLENNDAEKAIEYYSKAIEKATYVDKWYFYYERGNAYLTWIKNLNKAIPDLKLAIDTLPKGAANASIVYNTLGVAYYYIGDYENAKTMQLYAVELEKKKEKPNKLLLAVLLHNVGSDLAVLGNLESALNYYSDSIEYTGDGMEGGLVFLDRGLCYIQLNRDRDALTDLTQSIKLLKTVKDSSVKKSLRQAYLNRGQIYERMVDKIIEGSATEADYQNAFSDYTAALKVDPTYQIAYNVRGLLYWRLKKFENAQDDLKQSILLDPSSPGPHITLSAIYNDQGLTALATEELNIAAHIGSFSMAKSYTNRATIYYLISYSWLISNPDSSKSDLLKFLSPGSHDENIINDCTQAITLDSSQEDCYLLRGGAYFRLWASSIDPFSRIENFVLAENDLHQVIKISKKKENLEMAQNLLDLMEKWLKKEL